MTTTSQRAYQLLTEDHTFLVVDVETTVAEDGSGVRVVSLAVVPVIDGIIGTARYWLVNPGQPIDANSMAVHGITDDKVARCHGFSRKLASIDKALRVPDAVFVAHSAGGDASAIRGEYERAGQTMPDLPVIDTMLLPSLLGLPIGKRPSLTALAAHYSLPRVRPHDARDDARVTARCLTRMLAEAADDGHTDLAALLRRHRRPTTLHISTGPLRHITREREPDLDPSHLALHAHRLPDPPTITDLDGWVAAAVDCARLRCPLLRDRARQSLIAAADLHPRLLAALPTLTEPGQAATAAGALLVLAEHALTPATVLPWWSAAGPALAAAPDCQPGQRCPDCREGLPCPLDIGHQTAARVVCDAVGHPAPTPVINRVTGTGSSKRLVVWVRQGQRRLAGYAAWLLSDQLTRTGNPSRASAVIDQAVTLGLADDEPRIALVHATARAALGHLNEAAHIAATALLTATSDDGYTALAAWLSGPYAQMVRASTTPAPRNRRPPPRNPRPQPRNSRPASRTRTNLHK